jgi:hypothetical protein
MIGKCRPQIETGVKDWRGSVPVIETPSEYSSSIYYAPLYCILLLSLGSVYTCAYTVPYSSCIENIDSGLMDLMV